MLTYADMTYADMTYADVCGRQSCGLSDPSVPAVTNLVADRRYTSKIEVHSQGEQDEYLKASHMMTYADVC
jgi:hypothetical protein